MENIKITAENLRFFLKVSITKVNGLRKERATKLKNFLSQQKNKSKEKKLESSNNKFFNNINSIKRESGGIFRNPAKFSESILEVVSLLLLGTAINNILPEQDKFYNKNLEIPDYDFFSPNAFFGCHSPCGKKMRELPCSRCPPAVVAPEAPGPPKPVTTGCP